MNFNYDDIIGGSSSDSEEENNKSIVSSLVETMRNYTFAITINHPRCPIFLNVDSFKQKLIYMKVWGRMAYMCNVLERNYTFEYCQSGQIHLHGIVTYQFDQVGSILGLISDIVKSFLPYLGIGVKANSVEGFKERNMFPQYMRYRSPSLCIQFLETDKAINDWNIYMQKEQ